MSRASLRAMPGGMHTWPDKACMHDQPAASQDKHPDSGYSFFLTTAGTPQMIGACVQRNAPPPSCTQAEAGGSEVIGEQCPAR